MKRRAVLPRGAGRRRSSPCSRTASPRRTARSGVRGPRRPVRLGHRTGVRRRSGPADDRVQLPWRQPDLRLQRLRSAPRHAPPDEAHVQGTTLLAATATIKPSVMGAATRSAVIIDRSPGAGNARARRHGDMSAVRARRARFQTVEGLWAGLTGSPRGPPGSPGPGGRADRLPHRAVPATRVVMSLRETRKRRRVPGLRSWASPSSEGVGK
jgi:hypothetical protein